MTNNTEILRTEGLKRSYLVNETKISDAVKLDSYIRITILWTVYR